MSFSDCWKDHAKGLSDADKDSIKRLRDQYKDDDNLSHEAATLKSVQSHHDEAAAQLKSIYDQVGVKPTSGVAAPLPKEEVPPPVTPPVEPPPPAGPPPVPVSEGGSPRLTSTKNEVVDAERIQRGLQPIASDVAQSHPQLWAEAEQRMDENPLIGRTLVDNYVSGARREVSELDEAILLREKIATQNAREVAADRANDTTLSEAERATARLEFDALESHNNNIDIATDRSGQIWGRFGRFRQRLAADDYSLAAVEKRIRAAQGGNPLTVLETAAIKPKVAKLSELTEKRMAKTESLQHEENIKQLQKRIAAMNERLERQVAQRKGLEEKPEAKVSGKPTPYDLETETLVTELSKVEAMEREGKVNVYEQKRLAARKEQLERQIAQRKGLEKAPTPKEKVEPDVEVEAMETELKRLKTIEAEEKQAAREKTKESRQIAKRNERLERVIAEIKGLEPAREKGAPVPSDVETEALQTELQGLRAVAKEKNQLPAAKERALNRIQEIQQRLTEYAPGRKPDRIFVKPDAELREIQYQESQAKSALDKLIFEAELKTRTVVQKSWDYTREGLALPRALIASSDLSAYRQAGPVLAAHPIRTLKSLPDSLRTLKSDREYFRLNQELRERPNARDGFYHKDLFTDVEAPSLAQMEEQFMSRLANVIPIVKQSQRAFVYTLNRVRADVVDSMIHDLGVKPGEVTQKQIDSINDMAKVFTGRGILSGKYANAAAAMNTFLFAPRWVVSRFQLLLGQPLWKADASVRPIIAKEYARMLAGYGTVLGLATLAGKQFVEVERDPRSTDFGKLKFGNTRLDLLSGLSQSTVLLSRLGTGKIKTAKGEIQPIYGKVPYGKSDASDIAKNFLRAKLAPVPASALNYLSGKNVVGEPVTLPSTIRDLTVPLSGRDIFDAMKEQGIPAGAALGLLAIFGAGVQTYSPRVSSSEPKPSKRPY